MLLNTQVLFLVQFNTSFIDTTPELFLFPNRKDRGTKLLNYIGNVTVNGFPGVEKKSKPVFGAPRKPTFDIAQAPPSWNKTNFREQGVEGLSSGLKNNRMCY